MIFLQAGHGRVKHGPSLLVFWRREVGLVEEESDLDLGEGAYDEAYAASIA